MELKPLGPSALVVDCDAIAGWVFKYGRRFHLKTRRYLVFDGQKLSQYRSQKPKPTWQFDASTLRLQSGSKPRELIVHHGNKMASFIVASEEEYSKWLGAIRKTSRILEDWYTPGKQIGQGSYGVVHVGRDTITGDKVAIKTIKKKTSSRRQSAFMEREVKILQAVAHKNIIKTRDVFETDDQLCIVSEFMAGGELFERILEESFFTEDKARQIMRQLLQGVGHLHGLNFVHRDVKPENILCVNKSWPLQIKLTDFGLSNVIDDSVENASQALLSQVGTTYYLAPEVVGKQGYGMAVDIWACGVVLFIMLCGRFPFWGKTNIEYLASVNRGPAMSGECWAQVSQPCKEFVRSLLEIEPSKRPTAVSALEAEWMQSTEGTLVTLSSQVEIARKLKKR